MSLSKPAARAMAVKMLKDDELKRMHLKEEARGCHFLPYEIARFSERARKLNTSINTWWNIPSTNETLQGQHAEQVNGLIFSLMREKDCSLDIGDPDSRANFDWHVHRAALDFTCEGGRRSARTDVEDVEAIFGGPADRKTAAAGN